MKNHGRAGLALALCLMMILSALPVFAQELTPAPEPVDGVVYEPEEEEMLSELILDESALKAVDGMTNILLLGIDARPREKTGRSDTMILLTLDADHNCVKLTSFMRDLYVEIPGRKNNRLNAAYVFGGPELLIRTLRQNFGIDVDYYVAVNFSVLGSVIDQLGGVTVTVDPKYVKRVNAVIREDNKVLGISVNDGLLKEGGEQNLTGKQAQAYARYRYGTDDGDFGRTVRQREIILKCMEKVKDMSMSALVQLAISNLDNVTTNMTVLDMVALAPAALRLKDAETRELRIPVDKGYQVKTISGMWVMLPDREKNLNAIKDFMES